jgi:hypothetical protein
MRDACRQRPQAQALCGDANKLLPGLFEKIKYKEFTLLPLLSRIESKTNTPPNLSKTPSETVELSLPMMYQFIYSRSHVVQDAFLGLLQLELLTMEPTTLLGLDDPYAASPLRYDLAYFSVCDGQARYEPSVEKRPECEKYGVLDIRAPMTSLYRQLMAHRSEVKPFPVSIIAASSLFLTLAFYVGLAVYAAIVFAARHASGLMLSDKYLDLKVAPLAIGAIYAIICLVPVGGIAMLLWTCAS